MFQKPDDLVEQIRELARQLEAERVESTRMRRKIDEIQGLVRTNGRVIRSIERASAQVTFEVARMRIVRRLEKLAASRRAVVVGPWYGEIGFETICWAPFVRWALLNHGFDLGRVGIVSRGGAGDMYGLDAPYVELFDLVSPHKLRVFKAGQQKQDAIRQLDRQLAGKAARRLGMHRPHLLHPALMYATLAPFWSNLAAPDQVLTVLEPHRITPPRLPDLPARYVAARFYTSRAFPDTPRNGTLATTIVERLAETTAVVLLRSGTRFDDHADLPPPSAPNVKVIDVGSNPASNLSVQMSVMAHAQSFVGTYGGGAYLAALTGVPVLALWSEATWRLPHLALAQALFRRTNGGRFSVVSCDELALALGLTVPTP